MVVNYPTIDRPTPIPVFGGLTLGDAAVALAGCALVVLRRVRAPAAGPA